MGVSMQIDILTCQARECKLFSAQRVGATLAGPRRRVRIPGRAAIGISLRRQGGEVRVVCRQPGCDYSRFGCALRLVPKKTGRNGALAYTKGANLRRLPFSVCSLMQVRFSG